GVDPGALRLRGPPPRDPRGPRDPQAAAAAASAPLRRLREPRHDRGDGPPRAAHAQLLAAGPDRPARPAAGHLRPRLPEGRPERRRDRAPPAPLGRLPSRVRRPDRRRGAGRGEGRGALVSGGPAAVPPPRAGRDPPPTPAARVPRGGGAAGEDHLGSARRRDRRVRLARHGGRPDRPAPAPRGRRGPVLDELRRASAGARAALDGALRPRGHAALPPVARGRTGSAGTRRGSGTCRARSPPAATRRTSGPRPPAPARRWRWPGRSASAHWRPGAMVSSARSRPLTLPGRRPCDARPGPGARPRGPSTSTPTSTRSATSGRSPRRAGRRAAG